MKCPVCQMVYSYGRMISHQCGGQTFLFGTIFNERTPECQWNCNPHPKPTSRDFLRRSNELKNSSRFELLNKNENPKILYPWNCQSNQEDVNVILNLSISDKQLVYE